MKSEKLLSDQITREELAVIRHELERLVASNVPGDIVEFGCYAGTTSVHLQKALLKTGRQLHLYDSFAGLPPKGTEDTSPLGALFIEGALRTTKSQLIQNFKKAGLPLPIIHKCWFENLTAADIPEPIALAFLDGDFYRSILTPLKLIWPQLAPGAVVIIDDYHNAALPGARKAVDHWLASHPARLSVQASLAIIRP